MKRPSQSLLFMFVSLATSALLAVQTKPVVPPTTRELPQLVRLTSDEFIGLNGVCRIVEQPSGAIRVTLVSGSNLDLANPADVKAVRAGIAQLGAAGQVQLFEPKDGLLINLSQVTNIIWNEEGMTFWGCDGLAWVHTDAQQHDQTWKRLQEKLQDHQALSFVEVQPRMFVNLRHLQHVSVVNRELRLLMSNKMWPKIQGEANIKAVRDALARVSTAAK